MSNNMSCPNCRSQDIQEISDQQQKTTKSKNWKGGSIVVLAGFIIMICSALIDQRGGAILGLGFLLFLLSLPAGLFRLLKGSQKTEVLSSRYCVCRSCGHEFGRRIGRL